MLLSGVRSLLLSLLLLGAVGSCASPDSDTPDEIRVGLLTSRVEQFASLTHAARRGAKMALSELNREGVVVGGRRHRFVLAEESIDSTQEAGLRAFRKLVARDRVVAVVGPFTTTAAIPAGEAAERARIPMITPTASGLEVTRDRRFVFRITADTTTQGRLLARLAHDELQARRAAVLYDITTAYSRSYVDVFEEVFFELGGEIVARESYTAGDQDFTGAADRIREASADVVLLPNYPADVRLQARQLRAAHVQAILLGGDAWRPLGFDDRLFMEGSFYSHYWHSQLAGARVQPFIESYREAWGAEPEPAAALTWDALELLARAIESAGSLDGERIRDALVRIEDHCGVSGRISFYGQVDPSRSVVLVHFVGGEARLYRQIEPNHQGTKR